MVQPSALEERGSCCCSRVPARRRQSYGFDVITRLLDGHLSLEK
jgi:hypothetical protein